MFILQIKAEYFEINAILSTRIEKLLFFGYHGYVINKKCKQKSLQVFLLNFYHQIL